MTWGTVGTIVGAVVGSVVPGVGTSLGAALGGAIGGMVDQASVPTSRLADLSAPRVSHGAPISLLFGHPRVGGNVIWCSPAIPSGTVGGSKGDGGGTETYVRHVLVMLGEGVTGPPTRIWAGGKLIHNRLATADDETLEASVEEAVIGEVIYYDGRDTQLPDPTYALAVGEDNAPAYRGKSTVMLKDFSVGTGGQLPPTTIEVSGVDAGRFGASTKRILEDFAPTKIRGVPPEGASSTAVSVVAIESPNANEAGAELSSGITTYFSNGDNVYNQVPAGFGPASCGRGNGDVAVAVYGPPSGTMKLAIVGSGFSESFPSQQPKVSLGSTQLRFSTYEGVIAISSSRAFGYTADFVGAEPFVGQVYLHLMDGTPAGMVDVSGELSSVGSLAIGSDFLWVHDGESAVAEYKLTDLSFSRLIGAPPGLRRQIFVSEEGALCCADSLARIYRWTNEIDGDEWKIVNTMDDYIPDGSSTPIVLGTDIAHHMVQGDTTYAVKTESLFLDDIPVVWYIESTWWDAANGDYFRFDTPAQIIDFFATVSERGPGDSYPGWAYSFTYGDPSLMNFRQSTYMGAEIVSITPFTVGGTFITHEIIVRVKAVRLYGYPGDSGDFGMLPVNTLVNIYRNEKPTLQEFKPVDVFRKRGADVYDLAEPTLQEVVEHLCTRAGLLPISVDATELATKRVHAFALTQIGATSSALELLMSVYRFYCVESGGKLVFRFAGAGSVRSIPHADLGASWSEPPAMPLPLTRGNPQELPSMESVRYANIDDDYQDGLESSDRLMQSVQSARTVEYAIGLHPDEAKQLAAITQQVAQTALVRIGPVSLGPEHREVEAGDVITLGLAGGGSIQMLTAATDYDRGIITAEGVRYDEADYTSDAVTANAYTPSMTVRRPPDTMAVLIDPPLWSDASDGPSFWVAAKPSRYPWRGYSLQRSASDVGYTEVYRDGHTAVFGECTTILPAWDGGRVVDWKSSVTVDVGAGQLSSITRAELLTSRANLALIGGEMLQYQTADLVATGVYTLTGFVRHLGGTEKVTHGAGETFALLDTLTMTRVPLNMAELAVPSYYRAVTLGRALDTAEPQVFAPAMVAVKPIAPARLRAIHLPNGDLLMHWQRRTRLQSNSLRGVVPLGETTEAYVVEVWDGSTLVRHIDAATTQATYTQAQQTADGMSTGYRIEVRQLGLVDGHTAILEI